MINMNLTPTYTYFKTDKETKDLLKDKLSFTNPDYFFARNFNPYVTQKICMVTGNKFPTGLLWDVLDMLDVEEIKYKLKYEFEFTEPTYNPEDIIGDIEKRDYQLDCVKKAIDEKRGYFLIATAGGKTEVARMIIQCINQPTLYLVHLKELLYQTRKSFAQSLGLKEKEIGTIGDGKRIIRPITIAMVQTLDKMMFNKSNKNK